MRRGGSSPRLTQTLPEPLAQSSPEAVNPCALEDAPRRPTGMGPEGPWVPQGLQCGSSSMPTEPTVAQVPCLQPPSGNRESTELSATGNFCAASENS